MELKKQVADITAVLKQIFFENKTIQRNTVDFDKKRKNAEFQLERTMKENNLVRINGVL